MFEMNVPYDKGQMKIKLEDKNLAGVLEGRQSDYKTTLSENEIVEQSLNNPIGSKSLEELAKGKKNIVIISSDHTRPVPSKIITPILLRRIRSVSPDARIRILVAAGFMHTPPKMYRQTLMPNAHVVIAKMCPLPWYFVFVKTSSQCTPTPNKIISPVDKNSAIKLCNINSNFLP